jgi:hypothetical protein
MRAFDALDEDQDGHLSFKEFRAFVSMLRRGRHTSKRKLSLLFSNINTNYDLLSRMRTGGSEAESGQGISAEEFKTFVIGSGRFGEAGRFLDMICHEEGSPHAARSAAGKTRSRHLKRLSSFEQRFLLKSAPRGTDHGRLSENAIEGDVARPAHAPRRVLSQRSRALPAEGTLRRRKRGGSSAGSSI